MTIKPEAFVTEQAEFVTNHPETAAFVTKRHQNVTMTINPEAVVTKRAEFVTQHNIKAVFGNNPGRNMLEEERTEIHLRGN